MRLTSILASIGCVWLVGLAITIGLLGGIIWFVVWLLRQLEVIA